MIEPGSPEFPVAKDDDDDDVAWALSTAQVQWKRGSQADAVVWLRRAIDSAVSVGATWRAAELTRQTDAVEAHLLSGHATGPSAFPGSASGFPATRSSFPAAPPRSPFPAPPLRSSFPAPPLGSSFPAPQSVIPGEPGVELDDYDGTDMIDADVLSLPPDAEIDEPAATSGVGQHPYTADDEQSTITHEEARVDDEIVEIEEVEEDEVADEDEIAEDALDDDEPAARARFASEAPTANLVVRAPSEPETEIRNEVPSRPAPARYTQASEPEYDPAPTPLRMSVVPPSAPSPAFVPVAEPAPAPAPVPEPEPAPEPPPPPSAGGPPPSSVPTEPFVAGILLSDIRGFEDFPPETQLELARAARVERLATEEEVSGFGLALVLRGAVSVMPTIADVACGAAGERELVYGRGTLPDGVPLRLVATAPDTQIAVWSFDSISAPLAACPWVLEELEAVADRYQALAGVSMGPMGDRLDDSLRGMVLSRCRLVRLLPGEVLVEKGKPVGGLFIVGGGKVELGTDTPGSAGELLPGDFLFAQQVLMAGSAPTTARAGASGALLMAADRHAAHELMLSVPPLLELLAG